MIFNFRVRGLNELLKAYLADSKFIKFLLVGLLNTIFGYSVYALFIFLNFHYSVAAFLSTILGVLFNFKTTGKLVFNNSNNKLIFKFIAVYVFTYLLNISLLTIFNFMNINMYLAGALLLLPVAIIAFMLNRRLVFKEVEH